MGAGWTQALDIEFKETDLTTYAFNCPRCGLRMNPRALALPNGGPCPRCRNRIEAKPKSDQPAAQVPREVA